MLSSGRQKHCFSSITFLKLVSKDFHCLRIKKLLSQTNPSLKVGGNLCDFHGELHPSYLKLPPCNWETTEKSALYNEVEDQHFLESSLILVFQDTTWKDWPQSMGRKHLLRITALRDFAGTFHWLSAWFCEERLFLLYKVEVKGD